MPNSFDFKFKFSAVFSGGAGGARAPPEFRGSQKGRSLISAFQSLAITTNTPGFEKLNTALAYLPNQLTSSCQRSLWMPPNLANLVFHKFPWQIFARHSTQFSLWWLMICKKNTFSHLLNKSKMQANSSQGHEVKFQHWGNIKMFRYDFNYKP